MKSRVHPTYKTKYHVGNWPEYYRALVQRGDITLWISADAIDAWKPTAPRKRGGQQKFSNVAIETALTLRLVFKLPLRQTEGFLRWVLSWMDCDLEAPITPRSHGVASTWTSTFVESQRVRPSISSWTAPDSQLWAKANGPQRNMEGRVSEAGRSSISASTDRA
jgi:hypothetical protein